MGTATSRTSLADFSSWNWLHWTGVLLSIGIAAVNLYVGYLRSDLAFLVIAFSFLFGVGLFCTRLWEPILYLLGVVHVGALGVLWVLEGLQHFELGVLTGVLSVGLAAIALYLFVVEESTRQQSTG